MSSGSSSGVKEVSSPQQVLPAVKIELKGDETVRAQDTSDCVSADPCNPQLMVGVKTEIETNVLNGNEEALSCDGAKSRDLQVVLEMKTEPEADEETGGRDTSDCDSAKSHHLRVVLGTKTEPEFDEESGGWKTLDCDGAKSCNPQVVTEVKTKPDRNEEVPVEESSGTASETEQVTAQKTVTPTTKPATDSLIDPQRCESATGADTDSLIDPQRCESATGADTDADFETLTVKFEPVSDEDMSDTSETESQGVRIPSRHDQASDNVPASLRDTVEPRHSFAAPDPPPVVSKTPPVSFIVQNDMFVCGKCKAAFKRFNSIKLHITLKHGHSAIKYVEGQSLNYSCEVCGSVFSLESQLASHMKSQHSRAFACYICDARFSESSLLTEHMRQHTHGVTLPCFACPKCDAFFTRKFDLTAHVETHPEDATHKCSMCNKTFSSEQARKSHIRTHAPFACSVCEAPFRLRNELDWHMKIQHSNPPEPAHTNDAKKIVLI